MVRQRYAKTFRIFRGEHGGVDDRDAQQFATKQRGLVVGPERTDMRTPSGIERLTSTPQKWSERDSRSNSPKRLGLLLGRFPSKVVGDVLTVHQKSGDAAEDSLIRRSIVDRGIDGLRQETRSQGR